MGLFTFISICVRAIEVRLPPLPFIAPCTSTPHTISCTQMNVRTYVFDVLYAQKIVLNSLDRLSSVRVHRTCAYFGVSVNEVKHFEDE